MLLRRDRLVLLAFALLAAAWVVAEVGTGADTGLLYLAPALGVCAPLLLGRYPGEDQIAQLAGRSTVRAPLRPSRVAIPRSHVRVMKRGGRLVGSALAKRPPPALVSLSTA
jgi:hypothetical protein